MARKIKNSLGLKVFLGLSALLFTISLLIYGIIMAMMPVNYASAISGNFQEQVKQLAEQLGRETYDEGCRSIYEFCLNNNTIAHLKGEKGEASFGAEEMSQLEERGKATTATVLVGFKDSSPYQLTITISQKPANQLTMLFWKMLPVVALIIFAISALASMICTRLFTRRIIGISDISKRMAKLDMTWRCDVDCMDEIGVLGSNMNLMAQNLKQALDDLKTANKRLQADIERERIMEKQRRDFFAMVSHELKTPLTILKGNMEGMLYSVGDYKDRDTYLRQSLKTAQSMERLIEEILTVSRMEGDDFKLQIKEIDFGRIINKICREYLGLAEDKGIDFRSECAEDGFVQGEEGLLYKAVSNVVGNAVFHSSKGSTVLVSLTVDRLEVQNTGVHIADEDMERIFQPFYRVEQSHNRNTGGSGLGLYLVKNILERHGFRYKIMNTKDGILFTIFLIS